MSTSKRTTDHATIQRWVEQRNGHPARVAGTGGDGDPGILRIDFEEDQPDEGLEAISWDEFFEKFDENELAFVYQDTADGNQPSRFNKLVSR